MGYNASYIGEITLTDEGKQNTEVICKKLGEGFQNVECISTQLLGFTRVKITVSGFDNFEKNSILNWLSDRHYVEKGHIDLWGEDDCAWRCRYEPATGRWREYAGYSVFEDEIIEMVKTLPQEKKEQLLQMLQKN